jgi:hypothetical protein
LALPLNYAVLYYHCIELLCFHYNGSGGVSFLLQQCIALDDFSEGHSDYWTFGLVEETEETTDLPQITDKLHHIMLCRLHLA